MNHLRHCRTQIQPPGTRFEEAGTVRRILHGVRECDQLLVVVVGTAEQLTHTHTSQAGRLRTDDGQGPFAIAVRTVVVRLREGRTVSPTLTLIGCHIDRQQ